MNKEQGYIKLNRCIQDNFLWLSDEPFSKRDAWIDLLLSANYKESKVLNGNETIVIERGEILTSLSRLSERWRWSKSKVNSYLELLEKEKMITRKKNTKRTVIKCLNFGKYQDCSVINFYDKKNTKKTQKEHEKNTKRTIQEIKNSKNTLNNNIKSESVSETHTHTQFYGRHKNIELTEEQYAEYKAKYPFFDEVLEELSDAIDVDPKKYQNGDITSWINKFIRQKQRKNTSSETKYKELN